MPLGLPRSFHDKFKFIIEIDGIASAGFNKMSELSVEAAKIEYYECVALILYQWFLQVADGASFGSGPVPAGQGAGLPDPQYKRMLDLVQQDRDGTALRRWRLFNAWPQKFTAGEWDNDTDEKVIEMVVLTFDNFEPVPV